MNNYVKRKISVTGSCNTTCPHYSDCGYLDFKEETQSRFIDIQVCNHQYLLADTIHRRDGIVPLLPNYQSLVIDEAHKFVEAAQSMYGLEFSSSNVLEIFEGISKISFKDKFHGISVRQMTKKLFDENKKLFRELVQNNIESENNSDESERLTATITPKIVSCLINIGNIANYISAKLLYVDIDKRMSGYKQQLAKDLTDLSNEAYLFAEQDNLICWFEIAGLRTLNQIKNWDCKTIFMNEMKMCAIPKELDVSVNRKLTLILNEN